MLGFELKIQINKVWIYFELKNGSPLVYKKFQHISSKIFPEKQHNIKLHF